MSAPVLPTDDQETRSPDIHEGYEGWLFLVGGTNQVIRYYTSDEAFPDVTAEKWVSLLRARKRRCGQLGIAYLHLIAPDKITVYSEFFAESLPFLERCPAMRLPAMLEGTESAEILIDLMPAFRQEKSRRLLYWKTDTHWCFAGCYTAYKTICERLGVPPNKKILHAPFRSADIVLDLGVKMKPPVRERFVMMDFLVDAQRVSANEIVAFKEAHKRENDVGLHAGSSVVFVNRSPTAVDMKIVLFGDSFAEYRPRLLTGMLAETFREVHFVWSLGLDWSYIEKTKPDLLLTEIAERFMSNVPGDAFALDAFVSRRLAAVSAAVG